MSFFTEYHVLIRVLRQKKGFSSRLWHLARFNLSAQLRWTGHVIRVEDNRLPKQVFYSQLEQGTRSHGGQRERYKDVLKSNLKACNIDPHDLESSVQDRSSWRALCKTSVLQFESDRVNKLQEKRSQLKAGVRPSTGGFTCVTCGRTCASFHTAEHIRDEIRRIDGSVHHHQWDLAEATGPWKCITAGFVTSISSTWCSSMKQWRPRLQGCIRAGEGHSEDRL